MPTEAEPTVGHLDALMTVLLGELVHVGDLEILVVQGVVQVDGRLGRGLTEPDRVEGVAHPRCVEPGRSTPEARLALMTPPKGMPLRRLASSGSEAASTPTPPAAAATMFSSGA